LAPWFATPWDPGTTTLFEPFLIFRKRSKFITASCSAVRSKTTLV
jgi:hypothetical protein